MTRLVFRGIEKYHLELDLVHRYNIFYETCFLSIIHLAFYQYISYVFIEYKIVYNVFNQEFT